MNEPNLIQHDAHEKRQKPEGNGIYYAMAGIVVFCWAVYLSYSTPDWTSIFLGAATSTAVLLIGFSVAADRA